MPTDEGKKHARASSRTGMIGEDVAANYLARHGCRVITRNWHANPGEVDIIAECPGMLGGPLDLSSEPVLVFVEVRTRHGRAGLAEESISRRKAASMALAAYAYMSAHDLDPDTTPWRLDLIAIAMSEGDISSVNWVKSAIDEDMLS